MKIVNYPSQYGLHHKQMVELFRGKKSGILGGVSEMLMLKQIDDETSLRSILNNCLSSQNITWLNQSDLKLDQ